MTYIRHILFAIVFFTRIRIPWSINFTGITLGHVVWTLPFMGVLVGSIVALVYQTVLWAQFTPWVAAWAALGAQFLTTGGLHEDGLADTADGMAFGRTSEQKIAIMRDSRIGSFGVLALILILGLQTALWAQLPLDYIVAIIISAAVSSRLAIALLMTTTPRACAEGSAAHAGDVSWCRCLLTIIFGSGIVLCLLPILVGIAMILGVGGLTLYLRRVAVQHFAGITGDVLGASQKLNEVLALAIACVVLRAGGIA